MEITITTVESQTYMKQIRIPIGKVNKTIYWRFPSFDRFSILLPYYHSQKQLTHNTPSYRPSYRKSKLCPILFPYHKIADSPQMNTSIVRYNHREYVPPISINITDTVYDNIYDQAYRCIINNWIILEDTCDGYLMNMFQSLIGKRVKFHKLFNFIYAYEILDSNELSDNILQEQGISRISSGNNRLYYLPGKVSNLIAVPLIITAVALLCIFSNYHAN